MMGLDVAVDQDDGAALVQEIIQENPPEDRGERDEWAQRVGWHRKEDVLLLGGGRGGLRGGNRHKHHEKEAVQRKARLPRHTKSGEPKSPERRAERRKGRFPIEHGGIGDQDMGAAVVQDVIEENGRGMLGGVERLDTLMHQHNATIHHSTSKDMLPFDPTFYFSTRVVVIAMFSLGVVALVWKIFRERQYSVLPTRRKDR
jgi:hypothetical protein